MAKKSIHTEVILTFITIPDCFVAIPIAIGKRIKHDKVDLSHTLVGRNLRQHKTHLYYPANSLLTTANSFSLTH